MKAGIAPRIAPEITPEITPLSCVNSCANSCAKPDDKQEIAKINGARKRGKPNSSAFSERASVCKVKAATNNPIDEIATKHKLKIGSDIRKAEKGERLRSG